VGALASFLPSDPHSAGRPPRGAGVKPLVTALVTLAVTAALVIYAFWDVDFAALGTILARGNYRALVPFQLLLAGHFAFTALRWQLILRPLGRFRVWQVIPAMMIGFGGNNLLPAHLGELARAIVFALRHECSRSAVLATLVLERLLDVFAILVLYTVAAFLIRSVPDSIRAGFWASAVVLGAAALGMLLLLRFPSAFVGAWERLSRPLPRSLGALGTRLLHGTEAGLAVLRSPRAVPPLIAYSLLKWLLSAGMVWLSLWGYGEWSDPALSLIVVAVMAVAVTLPSVPGFFGMIQAAFVFALTPFGITREVALASSVFYLLGQWVPVTAIGVAFFFSSGLGLSRVREEVGHAE
jgi:uncharacterized protein (TIRG00374 family)